MSFDLLVLSAGAMLAAAVLSTRLSARFGAPAMVLFVFVGMLAGSAGPGGIVFDDYPLTYHFGLLALVVIALVRGRAFSLREYVVVAWGGLKGAVPIVLAIYPILAGYSEGGTVFHLVFVTVLVTTVVQGMTLVPIAHRLGVIEAKS